MARDVLRIAFTEEQSAAVRAMSGHAEIGGRSAVRHDRQDRMESLGTDQLVGQYGECALHLLVFGDVEPYIARRQRINLTPFEGDSGSDIDGLPWDIKTSLMRAGPDPFGYRLPVRPAERHEDFVYILALMSDVQVPEVLLVGWIREEEIPQHIIVSGPFCGAHVVRASFLHPMEELLPHVERFRLEQMHAP